MNKLHSKLNRNDPYFKYETLKLNLLEEAINTQTDNSEEATDKYEAAEKALDEFVYKYLDKENFNEQ